MRSTTDNTCISAATATTVNAQPATPTAPVTAVTQPTCATATGTITVTVQNAGETYSFDNGTNFQRQVISNQDWLQDRTM